MNQEYEIIRYPKIKHINIFIDEISYRSQHLHSDYEFCFCLKGNAKFICPHDKIVANKGDIVFFDSKEVHSIETNGQTIVGIFVQISNLFLNDYLSELSSKTYINTNLKEYLSKNDINALFKKIVSITKKYFQETENYKIEVMNAVLELLNLTFSNVPFHKLNDKSIQNRKKDADRLQRITSYIDTHFQEAISLKDIAFNEGITTTHFSHLFSNGLGITFQEYLNERRLEYAIRLMNSSNKKIIDISYEAGFSDPKYLTKMFKKHFNSTPYNYKKKKFERQLINTTKNQIMLEKIFTEKESLSLLEKIIKK